MSVVQAAQVVYGNVEADHSPQHRGGFQVLFRSFSRLTEDVVTREIEPRLFFISTNPQDVKHCFFATQTGSVVVARCVPSATTDQFSRTGLYLAHALVFSIEDFRKLDNNPFHVLDHFEYFKSFEEARAAASADGDIPLVPVPFVASQDREASCPISRDQLLNLLILGYRCSRSQNQEASIGFYGQESKTLSILRSLFSLLPSRLRPKCSFDTFFVGGSFGRTPYWAVGFSEGQSRDPRFFPFEVERELFGTSIDLQPKTAFEFWLKWMFAPPLSDLAKHVDEALYLSEFLDGRAMGRDQLETQNTNTGVLLAFQPLFEGRLTDRLTAQVGQTLCERILPQVLFWAGQQGLAVLTPITDGFSATQLEQWITEACERSCEKPPVQELQELERFSSRNQRSILWLFYLRWTKQWHPLRSALRSADPSIARHFARWALATVSVFLKPTTQPGVLLGLGLFAEVEQLQETVDLLSAILDTTPDQILPTSAAESTGQPKQITIEQLVRLYALIVEKP